MNEFVEQFLIECRELIEQATDDLLTLEGKPDDAERIDGAFRAFHTLKGAAGIVDFDAMSRALHAAEDVLSSVRSGAQPVTPQLISACLTSLDQVVQWLDQMQVDGETPSQADTAADAVIQRFRGLGAREVAPAPPPAATMEAPSPAAVFSEAAQAVIEAQLALLAEPAGDGLGGRMAAAGRVVVNVLRHTGSPGADDLDRSLAQYAAAGDAAGLSQAIHTALAGGGETVPLSSAPETPQRPKAEAAARTLRVDVERIDALVNLSGELLVAKNALGHAVAEAEAGADPLALAALLKTQHAVLQRLVDDLQRSVLNIRVLQMRYVFQRFPRLVREMVVSLGKPAHLVTEGDDTEADKVIVESLFEPLLHVIRNALDHGVESPPDRAAAGKPPAATVTLRASRLNDHVIVEVEDDGAGVDVERVRAVAAARGVAAPDALEALSDAEVIDLIFAPGFSTAAEVTAISGRGVGMDAVRAAAQRLGGRVTVRSRPGAGTAVTFTLPFAVVMSRLLTVEAQGQLFGIPLEAVLETVQAPRAAIRPVGAASAFVFRNRTLPLIDLGEALGEPRTAPRAGEAKVVVVVAGGQVAGLEVDRLGERLDVMLKPMDGLLAGVPGVAGTSLLGDGRVLIVLDLQDLLQ